MKEIEDIIQAFRLAQETQKKSALATVVHVEGSSYRRPGARMLVTDDGLLTGAISGGCLEGDALRKAMLAIAQQQNKLVSYDTTDDEDNAFGIQLGCNGIVHILFEPINPLQQDHPIALLETALLQKKASVLVTLFSLDNPSGKQGGTCMLVTGEKQYGSIKGMSPGAAIQEDASSALITNTSLIKTYPSTQKETVTGFIELLAPPVQLIIAGAGNDAFPLVDIANILGWHVTMVDGRNTHANAQRFAKVKKIIVGKPVEAVQQLTIDEQSFVILMSHNYNYDTGMLRQLLHQPYRYIGILGPKKKLNKMLDELSSEGIDITEKHKEKIYGPVGLDIGAETAEEIALSIIAEIKAVMSGKEAAVLRNKNGFIHDHGHVATTGNVTSRLSQAGQL